MQMSPPPSSFGGFARNLLGSGFFFRHVIKNIRYSHVDKTIDDKRCCKFT